MEGVGWVELAGSGPLTSVLYWYVTIESLDGVALRTGNYLGRYKQRVNEAVVGYSRRCRGRAAVWRSSLGWMLG